MQEWQNLPEIQIAKMNFSFIGKLVFSETDEFSENFWTPYQVLPYIPYRSGMYNFSMMANDVMLRRRLINLSSIWAEIIHVKNRMSEEYIWKFNKKQRIQYMNKNSATQFSNSFFEQTWKEQRP